MKILVTGATGFLGRHLMRRLSAEHEVTGLARNQPWDTPYRYVRGDVLRRDSLEPHLAGVDVLVHAAGRVSHHERDAVALWDLHVNGTANALDAAKAAGVRRVVYLSTSGTVAVGRTFEVRDESSPSPLRTIQPWPYYRSKLFAEEEALRRAAPGFEVVSLNPSLLLGPGDHDQESTRSVHLFLQGRLNSVPPGGVSFVDVRDAADAVALALTRGASGSRYLLGAANWTWTAFYEQLAHLSGLQPPLMVLPRITRRFTGLLPAEVPAAFEHLMPISRAELDLACHCWYLDSRRARADLGWQSRDPAETLLDTFRPSPMERP